MYIDDIIHAIFYIINVDNLATQGAKPLPEPVLIRLPIKPEGTGVQ